ncbi:MAG: FAD-dependent oxidoreductase [Thermoanaerobaculia bacterium]|nr:FAD-dependent oxidoreductase [Thermoanaerobaculia bacterium]
MSAETPNPQSPSISRRDLLKALGLAGAGTVVVQATGGLGMARTLAMDLPEVSSDVGRGRHVVILGGGVGGLTAAFKLQQAGFVCTVLEARSVVGGRSLTLRRGDVLVEKPLLPYKDTGQRESAQTCVFRPGGATGYDRPYLNAGPGRIPSAHTHVLDLCKELAVPLEVYIMESRSNLVHGRAPSRVNRHVANDARGWIAQELYLRVDEIEGLNGSQRTALRQLLIEFGSLGNGKVGKPGIYAENGKYQRPDQARAGYKVLPGVDDGIPVDPLPLTEVLDTGFWATRFYQPEDFLWQPTLFQPIGGMDRIVGALVKAVGSRNVRTDAVVRGIEFDKATDQWILEVAGHSPIRAHACISNIPMPLLEKPLGNLDQQPFPPDFKAALRNVFGIDATGTGGFLAPTTKVGWQAPRALWQQPDPAVNRVVPIFGGISWTSHPMTQLWYPSDRIFDELGVLTGAYNFGADATQWGQFSPYWRLQQARTGAQDLGGDAFADGLAAGLAIAWQNIEHLRGGWAQWQNVPDGEASYNALLAGARDSRFYICGDQMSQLPGWQEGAVASALHATAMLCVPTFTAPTVDSVPDSRMMVEGMISFDLDG